MIYKQIINPKSLRLIAGVTLAVALSACTTNAISPTTTVATNVPDKITIDGSTTVLPISKAVVKDFTKSNPGIKITVGSTGSGIGFKKFCAGELDIASASRPIKKEENAKCAEKGIEFLELPIAIDGLTIAVNKENTWAKCLKTEEIKSMWVPEAEGKIISWNQVRADFPSETILFFGAGADSGTFDYFTEAIVGKVKVIRKDYQANEDENVTVKGIQSGIGGVGFFGIAYYEANAEKINAVEVDSGKGCIAPTPKNIISGAYQPLSRPLFIYVSKKSLKRPEVKSFVDYYVDKGMSKLVRQVGYAALPNEILPKVKAIVQTERTGSTFMDAAVGKPINELLEKNLK